MAGLEDLLASRAAFGMRLGLERMRALLVELGEPQRTFRALHVVGTNGKTSTTLFAAAMLEAHGLAAGAYISPHVHGFRERVQVGGAPLGAAALTAAVERVEAAASVVEATSDEPLTQFEVLTAAAFTALAAAGVDVVAVGGRPGRPLRRHQRARRAGGGADERRRSTTSSSSVARARRSPARSWRCWRPVPHWWRARSTPRSSR